MKTSDQGRALILEREGCRLEAYSDSVGVSTIGVGHTNGVQLGDTCTKEQADQWLADDLQWAEAAVNGALCALEQFEFDALVSFTFNVGAAAFKTSTMKRLLDAGEDRATVAAQFDRWNRPPEIISRRMGEKAQFLGEQFAARI